MAEFCLECWNKINGTDHPESRYVMSKEVEFCEECWGLKRIVIREKERHSLLGWLFPDLLE